MADLVADARSLKDRHHARAENLGGRGLAIDRGYPLVPEPVQSG